MLVVKNGLLSALMGPQALDVAVHQLTIVTRTWLGGQRDAPVVSGPQYTDAVLVIPQKYIIEPVKTEEIDASGGRFEMGDIKVRGLVPADPANPGIGYYPTQLAPVIVAGQEVIYLVAGQHNGAYALRELQTWDILSYNLILSRRLDTPMVVSPDASAGETPTP